MFWRAGHYRRERGGRGEGGEREGGEGESDTVCTATLELKFGHVVT